MDINTALGFHVTIDTDMSPGSGMNHRHHMALGGSIGYIHLHGPSLHHNPWASTWLQMAAQATDIHKDIRGNMGHMDLVHCSRTMDSDGAMDINMADSSSLGLQY